MDQQEPRQETAHDLEFTGERFMPGIQGNIEIEHLHRYLQACKITAGKVVLDIASGEGYGSAMMAENAARVIGVDIAEDAVRHAQARYGNDRLEYRVGNCAAIPLETASVDVVVSFETIEHHDQHEEMMREIKRVLRPDGVLLISSPDKHNYSDVPRYRNEFHVKELYEEDFRRLLESHFRHQVLMGQRVMYGSVISSMATASKFVTYRSAEGKIEEAPGVIAPLYWIALASDAPLQLPDGGIMEQALGETDFTRYWSGEVSKRDTRIATLEFDLETRDARVAVLDSDVALRDRQLSEQQTVLATTEQAVLKRTQQLAAERQRVAELQAAIAEQGHRLSECKGRLSAQSEEIARCGILIADQLRRQAEQDQFMRQQAQEREQLGALQKAVAECMARVDRFEAEIARQNTWREQAQTATLSSSQRAAPTLRRRGSSRLAQLARMLPGLRLYRLRRAVADVENSGLFDRAFYLQLNQDVAASGMDPLKHYLVHGWREHRDPSRDFSTAGYLEMHRDVAATGGNPLLHYVRFGRAEGRPLGKQEDTVVETELPVVDAHEESNVPAAPAEAPQPWDASAPIEEVAEAGSPSAATPIFDAPEIVRRSGPHVEEEIALIEQSGEFDRDFYCAMYEDVRGTTEDPLRHYCEIGWMEFRDPSPNFETRYYLDSYPDIRNARINPLWHYVLAGKMEHRRAARPTRIPYEDDQVSIGPKEDVGVLLIARLTVNDWAAAKAARPLFEGHLLPLLPHGDWGFYNGAAMFARQAALAMRHGVRGFCLDVPADEERVAYAERLFDAWLSCETDVALCLNLDLRTGPIAARVIAWVTRALAASNAVRIASRPLLVATVASDDHAAYSSILTLRTALDVAGVRDFHLVARWELDSPTGQLARVSGVVDALLEGPTTAATGGAQSIRVGEREVDMLPYRVVAAQAVQRIHDAERNGSLGTVLRTVVLGRDLSIRAATRTCVYTGFRLSDYRRWLDAALAEARRRRSTEGQIVFLDAWNDWNEGTFLEPDQQSGFARLNETSRALLGMPHGLQMPKVTVLVPNYNHARFLRRRLDSIYQQTYRNIEVILMDDSSTDESRSVLAEYAQRHPEVTRVLFNDVNSGGPFGQWAKGIAAATGDLVWIAESDDFCDLNFLEVLVRCFDDESVMLAHARCVIVDQEEQPIPNYLEAHLSGFDVPGAWTSSYVETAHREVRRALGIKNTIPNASGVLFRRPKGLPLLSDPAWQSMRVAGDWVLYLMLLKGGRIAYSIDTANYFRRYVGSAAEATFRRDVFYREASMASCVVAEHYDVPIQVLERCRDGFAAIYDGMIGQDGRDFESWYDYPSVLAARARRRPNIMVCAMAFYPGGAEIFPIRLANEFKRMGLSVVLFSTGWSPREDRIRRMLRSDVPVVETWDVNEMRDLIDSFGIEALNTHQWHIQNYPNIVPNVFHALRSHVASLHGMIEHGTAFPITELQLRQADANVSVWVYTADKNIKPFADIGLFDPTSPRFAKLPNGMQPPQIRRESRASMGIPDDAFVLCCVSRAIPDKGWLEAIKVVERARQLSSRDVHLVLVGNGDVYDELCNRSVPEFVHLVGFHENSVGHYAAADMGIMLTWFRSESFPLTIVDCLFAGKPYIATDVGEIRNTLTTPDGVAGAIIPLVDWQVPIEQAAEAVANFAVDRDKYQRAAALVPQIASRYHIDKVAEDYLRLFMSDVPMPGAWAHDVASAASAPDAVEGTVA